MPEADAGKVRVPDILAVGHGALGFAAQAGVGGVVEAEGVDVLIEGVRAHLQGHGHEGRVAAVLHGLCEGLGAVASGLPALYLLPKDAQRPLAVEGGAIVHGPRVKRRRKGDDLEDGPGLIGLRHHPLPGQLQERGRIGPGRVVGVHGGIGADGQYFGGVGVHDHPVGEFSQVHGGGLLQGGLQKALDARVHGQIHRVSGDGCLIVGLAADDGVAVPVGFVVLLAVRAGKVGVEGKLRAGLAVSVDVGKAQELAEQVPLRIVPLHIRIVADGPVLLEGGQLLYDGGIHLVLNLHLLIELPVPGVHLGHLGNDGVVVHIQQGRKDVGDTLPVRILGDGLGVHAHLIGGVALGKGVAVSVQNLAPFRPQGHGAVPLALGHLGIPLAVDDGHIIEVDNQRPEEQHRKGGSHQQLSSQTVDTGSFDLDFRFSLLQLCLDFF